MKPNFSFLEKSILATIVYYDIFDYPLTGFEVFKYLINPLHVVAQTENIQSLQLEPLGNVSFEDVLKSLKNKSMEEFIGEKNGFYFLNGRKNLFEQRIERQKIAAPRWKKVYRVSKILQSVPFVKMIAICNNLAIDNSKEDADIDFFIIIGKNRIWLTRFLITFCIWALGQYRHKKKITDKICLSFYITEDALNLEPVAIRPYDIYLAHWIVQLKPIYWEGQAYRDFILANIWAKNYVFNFAAILNLRHPEFKRSKFLSLVKKLSQNILKGFFGDIAEKIFRFIQKTRINHKSTEHEITTAVVISDKMLKFHENDKRRYFQEMFIKNLKERLVS